MKLDEELSEKIQRKCLHIALKKLGDIADLKSAESAEQDENGLYVTEVTMRVLQAIEAVYAVDVDTPKLDDTYISVDSEHIVCTAFMMKWLNQGINETEENEWSPHSVAGQQLRQFVKAFEILEKGTSLMLCVDDGDNGYAAKDVIKMIIKKEHEQ